MRWKRQWENEIPVILVDRTIEGEAGTHYTTAILSVFLWEGGRYTRKLLMEALPDGGKVVIIERRLRFFHFSAIDRRDLLNALDVDKYEIVSRAGWRMADG